MRHPRTIPSHIAFAAGLFALSSGVLAAEESASEGPAPKARGKIRVGVEEHEHAGESQASESDAGVPADETRIRVDAPTGEDVEVSFDWTKDRPHRIRIGEDVVIGADEVVDGDVVALGGDVIVSGFVEGEVLSIAGDVFVDGEVGGAVTAVWGSIELSSEAIVGGDVVAIGGGVEENRAQIGGESFSLNLGATRGGGRVVEGALLAGIAFSLVVFTLFGLVLGAFFREKTERMLVELAARPFRSLGLGLAVSVVGHLAFFLLLVTIIGMPISLVGWILWWAITQTGIVLGATRAAERLAGRAPGASFPASAFLGGVLLYTPLTLAALAYTRGGPALQSAGLVVLTLVAVASTFFALAGAGSVVSTRFGGGTPERAPEGERSEPLFGPPPPVRSGS